MPHVSQTLTPTNLTCDFLQNPVGIDAATPRLGWKYPICRNGLTQRAFEVFVASTPELAQRGEADVWSSGGGEDAAAVSVDYAGRPLMTGERVHWSVRATDNEGNTNFPQAPAYFEMGLLERSDWSAKWVHPHINVSYPAHFGLLRKDFAVKQNIRRARLYITARGLYTAHLNGQRVGNDYFRPGWTDYHKRIQ